jgi:L-aminopeptidase/D-esterase-like protein
MAAQRGSAVDFSQIRGLRVGHAQAPDGTTGVSVVRFDRAAPVVIDVRGGASATYDTGSLNLEATFGRRWALFFSGGSLYGLDAARGIRTRLLEEGLGQRAFAGDAVVVPVSGAAIFDIYSGRLPKADYQELGYAAARDASRSSPRRAGPLGAGCGARVGKYLGPSRTMNGGVGSAAARLPGGGRVGVLAVVNAVGAIRDPSSGEYIAGARSRGGAIVPPTSRALAHVGRTHTTLALVATDLTLSRPQLFRLAMITSTGLARAIVPFHTTTDGDMVFAASTERIPSRRAERRPGEIVDRIGITAAELAVEAVLSAVSSSR